MRQSCYFKWFMLSLWHSGQYSNSPTFHHSEWPELLVPGCQSWIKPWVFSRCLEFWQRTVVWSAVLFRKKMKVRCFWLKIAKSLGKNKLVAIVCIYIHIMYNTLLCIVWSYMMLVKVILQWEAVNLMYCVCSVGHFNETRIKWSGRFPPTA